MTDSFIRCLILQSEIWVADSNWTSGLSLLMQSLTIEQNVEKIRLYFKNQPTV